MQMQIGDKSLCRRCKYCWVSQNICSAYGTLKGYGCTMFEDSETHLRYPDYMKAQKYSVSQTNQKKWTNLSSSQTSSSHNKTQGKKKNNYQQQNQKKKQNYKK